MFNVSITMRGVDALSKSQVNEAVRVAMEGVGQRWRERYLAKRFTKKGAREYGFRLRSGELNPQKPGTYSNRKLRFAKRHLLPGGVLPLVYTGELRRQALYEVKTVKATADSRGAKVQIQLPRKANFHLKEMQAVSAPELVDLQNYLAGRLNLELQKAGARRTSVRVTIGGGPAGAAAA